VETKWIILIYFFFKFNWIFHCKQPHFTIYKIIFFISDDRHWPNTVWRYVKVVRQRTSRATSRHSVITTLWWYNILYRTPCIRQATFFKFKGKRTIEMLDKLITYIVYLYKTLYQVLLVAWANRITTRGYIGSHNRLDLIQSLVLPLRLPPPLKLVAMI
jgi:hypothetical protein